MSDQTDARACFTDTMVPNLDPEMTSKGPALVGYESAHEADFPGLRRACPCGAGDCRRFPAGSQRIRISAAPHAGGYGIARSSAVCSARGLQWSHRAQARLPSGARQTRGNLLEA